MAKHSGPSTQQSEANVPLSTKAAGPDSIRDTFDKAFPAGFTLVLFVSLALVYLLIAAFQKAAHLHAAGPSHFVLLADGWLHGHLYIEGVPSSLDDFTGYKGHWYVAFPPLPAILLLPFVAIFHLSHGGLLSLGLSLSMGILNIWLMLRVLTRFVHDHMAGETLVTVAWLLALFALGTETLYATLQGTTWYIAHVVATTFLLLSIGEMLGKHRCWLAAIFLGLAALSRSTTLLAFPFFLMWTFVLERKQPLVVVRKWAQAGGVLAIFVMGMLLYNYVRFGSLLDFGYSTMHVNPILAAGLYTYGQFSTHFILTNLRFMLLQPPRFIATFPYLSFNPFGTGIFWTMPALLFAFLAFRRKEQRWLAASLLAACILPMILLLMYFNTGWYQFGSRFALDFLPFLFLLAALGMSSPLTWLGKTLIALSILINLWSCYVFAHFPPPLWDR